MPHHAEIMQKSSMNARVPQLPYVIAVLFLLAGFCLYGSAGHDDSHITFWASYTLEHYGDILNYNGDRVEQSSSLLLTLLIALIAKLTTVDVVSCGYVLTYLAGAAAILLCWQAAETWEVTYPLAALLLLASSPAFLLWNTSGMESTLAAVCVLGFVLVWGNILDDQRTPTPAAVGRGLLATLALVTVRPEMISLVTALAFAVFIYRRIGRWRGRVALIVFYATVLLAISGVIVFRHFYFGSPVPLPVYAKVSSFSARHLQEGMFYLLHYALANPVMLFGLGAALFQLYTLLRNEQRQPAFGQLLLAIALLAYAAFIIITGGDWMQAGRFLVPVLPLAALNLVIFLAAYSSRTVTGCCLMLILLQVYMNVLTLRSDSHGTPLWASYHITAEHQQRYTRFEQYNQEHCVTWR